MITLIAALAENRVIGKDNDLIWHLSADLKRFKALTTGHHIIMGRKTFESIGKPLPNRTTVIITRNTDYQVEGCITAHSLEAALDQAKGDDQAFIIGGAEIYKQALCLVDRMELTRVEAEFDGDAFFPEFNEENWTCTHSERHQDTNNPDLFYRFETWDRK